MGVRVGGRRQRTLAHTSTVLRHREAGYQHVTTGCRPLRSCARAAAVCRAGARPHLPPKIRPFSMKQLAVLACRHAQAALVSLCLLPDSVL